MKRARSFQTLFSFPFALAGVLTTAAAAQTPAQGPDRPNRSVAFEADVLAYGIHGYSAMVNVSLRSGFQAALGTGRYDVPSFLLEGDDNYDVAHWKATSTSVQVLRVTYRFKGPMGSGPALGAVVLNQNWRLRSEALGGETRFRPLSVGLTAGYYLHLTRHLYVYPTTAFTYNSVISGQTSVNGVGYRVARLAPNASLHMGWAVGW